MATRSRPVPRDIQIAAAKVYVAASKQTGDKVPEYIRRLAEQKG